MPVDVGSALGHLDLDISGFLSSLRSAQDEASKVSKTTSASVETAFSNIGQKLSTAGKVMTATVTTPIVGIGTAAVKTTAGFESAMSKVSAISGASGDDLDALSDKAKEMGAKTKFSASEAAEAFQYMAMAGWKTEDMLSGIDGIMALSAADGLDLASTSDIVTDALTAFGLSSKDSGHFADVLAKASSNANTNVSMLGESFKYAAPVAGALGYSAEDTAIALGLMANAGIKGSQGGTALRASLSRLIKPTDEVYNAMEKYGLSITNQDGSMKSLGEVMDMLRGKLGGLSEAEQAQTASALFGQEAMSGMLAIINTSSSDYDKLSDAVYNADGAAQQMADTMLDNLNGRITILKSSLEGLSIQFGEILMPYIEKFTGWIQDLVTKLQNLSEEQKEQIAKWAAIIAAVGPCLLVFGKLSSGVGNLIGTFGKLGAALPKVGAALSGISAPVIAVVAIIAVLVAAFVHLWQTNEDFRNKITEIWNGIKEKFNSFSQGIVDKLNELGFNFESITDVLKAAWEGLCNFLAPIFEGVFQYISDVFSGVLDTISGIFDIFVGIFTGDWDQVWTGVKEVFGGIWEQIKATFVNVWNVIKGTADVILGWFGTTWNDVWASVGNFFTNTWNAIKNFFVNIWNSIVNGVKNFVGSIVTFFSELPQKISNVINNVISSIGKFVTDMVSKAKEVGKKFVENVIDFFSNLPEKLGFIIGYAIGAVAKFVTDMVAKAKELGKKFVENVVNFFKELPGKISTFITNAYNKVKAWAISFPAKAKEAAQNFLNNVVNGIKNLASSVKNVVTNAFNEVKTWALNMAAKAKETAQNFFNNLVNGIKNLPTNVANIATAVFNTVKNWAVNLANKAKEAATNMFNNIINGIKKLPGEVLDIGKNIVQGIWNGISGAAGWLADKVKSFANGIVGGIKSALGIASPSKVMRDQIGKFLPSGIGEGFKSTLPKMLDGMKNQFNTGLHNLRNKLDVLHVDGIVANDDFDFDTNWPKRTGGGGRFFDYDILAAKMSDVLRRAPIQPQVNVDVQDGDVYLDKERVGRTIAPVVSRVVTQN